MQSIGCKDMRLGHQLGRIRAAVMRSPDQPGWKGSCAPFTGITFVLAEALMRTELFEQQYRQGARAKAFAGRDWNEAGGWVIFSQPRQENFSRSASERAAVQFWNQAWTIFHWRGRTLSVLVMSSPNLHSLSQPQRGHA